MYVLVFPAIQRDNERRVDEANIRAVENAQAFQERIDQHINDLDESELLIAELKIDINTWAERFDLQERTNRVLHAYSLLGDERYQDAVDMAEGISTSGLAFDIIEMAENINVIAYPRLARIYYDEGVQADRERDYVKAMVDFEKSFRYVDEEVDYFRNLLYYLAFVYVQNGENIVQARDYLNIIIERYPNFQPRTVATLLNDVLRLLEE
jgi:TolA-binding protein